MSFSNLIGIPLVNYQSFLFCRCDVCGKSFGQSYNLKIHSRLHSGEKPYECKICGLKVNTTASYNAHMKTHKNFKCEICNEIFNQKIKYMSHMGMHETGKVLECNICGKKFGRSSNFYNHQRIHMGIKKFKCYICGHGFVKAANLDTHLLIHCKTTSTNSTTAIPDNNDYSSYNNSHPVEVQSAQPLEGLGFPGNITTNTTIDEELGEDDYVDDDLRTIDQICLEFA